MNQQDHWERRHHSWLATTASIIVAGAVLTILFGGATFYVETQTRLGKIEQHLENIDNNLVRFLGSRL